MEGTIASSSSLSSAPPRRSRFTDAPVIAVSSSAPVNEQPAAGSQVSRKRRFQDTTSDAPGPLPSGVSSPDKQPSPPLPPEPPQAPGIWGDVTTEAASGPPARVLFSRISVSKPLNCSARPSHRLSLPAVFPRAPLFSEEAAPASAPSRRFDVSGASDSRADPLGLAEVEGLDTLAASQSQMPLLNEEMTNNLPDSSIQFDTALRESSNGTDGGTGELSSVAEQGYRRQFLLSLGVSIGEEKAPEASKILDSSSTAVSAEAPPVSDTLSSNDNLNTTKSAELVDNFDEDAALFQGAEWEDGVSALDIMRAKLEKKEVRLEFSACF
jgi:hypothetical protein